MRKLLAMLVFLYTCKLALSQVTLSGVVLDSATREPLSNTLIALKSNHVIANEKGRFIFPNLSEGNHHLMISHVGCDDVHLEILLVKDTFINLFIPHHLHSLTEIVKRASSNVDAGVQLIEGVSRKKLEHLAAVSISDALQEVSGVHFLRTGASIAKPLINGMHSNRVSIINDDSKQEGQQWGREHSPEIDPLSAGSLEVIKGASTLRFGGDAMGGVIRLLPAKFDDTSYNRLTFLTKLESNPRGGLVGLKYDNYNVKTALGQRFVFNAKRNGDSRSSEHYLSNTGFYQLSGSYFGLLKRNNNEWSLNASYFGQKLGILSSSHIGNLTDLNRALASDTPLIINPFTYEIGLPSQVIHHFTGKLKWKYASERIGELTASYTVQNNQRQEFDSHRGSKGAALDLNLWTQQLNLWVVKPVNQFKLQYGAMGESQQNKFQGRYFIPNYLRYKSGAFAILTAEKSRSIVEAGLRYDYQYVSTFRYQKEILLNEKFNYSGLSANLSGWLKVNEDIKTYFSLSTRVRNPDINELFSDGLHHGSAQLEFGSLEMTKERAYSLSSAIHYAHNKLRFRVEPFYHYFQNFIYLKPSGETQLSIRGAFPVFNYVQTNARFLGSDIDLQYQLNNHWSTQIDASFLWVKDIKNNRYIFGIPSQRIKGELKYAIIDRLGLRNGHFRFGAQYVARQNRVEDDEDFAVSPSDYFLLHSEIGAHYKKTPLHFSLGINNLLNTSYRDYMNRYRYYADDLGRNFYIIINYTI